MRQRPLLFRPAIGELPGEEPAVGNENLAMDVEGNDKAVLRAESQAHVAGVEVVELAAGARGGQDLSNPILEKKLAVWGLSRVRVRVRVGSGVVIVLVGHHIEEGWARSSDLLVERRRRGHWVEEAGVEGGVELGVARRVGGVRRRGVGGWVGGAGGVHGGVIS